MNKKQYLKDPQFASYLAGLWEGDGHISCPKYNEQNMLINTPAFHVTFGKRNLPLCQLLCSHYGGWIRDKRKDNALVWSITRKNQLISITTLLNGFLRTPKIDEFNQLLPYLNGKSPVKKLAAGIDCSPLENNYWLAPFIDTDGGFKIRVSKKQRLDVGRE